MTHNEEHLENCKARLIEAVADWRREHPGQPFTIQPSLTAERHRMDLGSQEQPSQFQQATFPVSSAAIDKPARVGAPLYTDVWPNRKVARVAAMSATGYSCTAIAAILDDGTTRNQVACMIGHWGVQAKSSDPRKTYCDVPVPLCAKHRTVLGGRSSAQG